MDIILNNWATIIVGVITYILAPTFRNWLSYKLAIRKDDRSRKQKIFEEYSKRYSHLLASLLEHTHSFNTNFDITNPKLRRSILEFYMLTSEEFYLQRADLIDNDIWQIWNNGIQFHLKLKFFQEGWDFAKKQMDFEGPFSNYIDEVSPKTNSQLEAA